VHCIFSSNNPINASNPTTKSRKVLKSYFKSNGVTTCGSKTFYYCKKIEEQVNSLMEGSIKGQPIEKNLMCLKV
jgi:hypothetical protein